MTVDDLQVPPSATPAAPALPRHPPAGPYRVAVRAAVGLALAAAVVARFASGSPLWLDEALTVNIARLPWGEIPDALRHDGAPPLYYFLLHGWMAAFGHSDFAVRALSGVLSVAALPLIWAAGHRLSRRRGGLERAAGDRRLEWSAVLLLASSPFAIRYATEARMYALVVLLVLAGYIALDTVLDRRSPPAAMAVALITGALLLTHYWSLFLVVAMGVVLLPRAFEPPTRAGARRALASMAAGGLLFLPWLPSFLVQTAETGTPWGGPPKVRVLFDAVMQFGAGLPDASLPLGLLTYALLALGTFGVPVSARPPVMRLELAGRPPGRALALVVALTLTLAVVVGRVTGAAFAIRYAAVVFPLVLLLAALGWSVVAATRAGPALLAVMVALGLAASAPHVFVDKTSAGRVAAALRDRARPGDVVAYCPDQLGPSVSRLLGSQGPAVDQLTFPRGSTPELVDWVDYEAVNEAAETAPFARMLVERAGPGGTVWVVWAPGYRTFGTKCERLLADLDDLRPTEQRVVRVPTTTFERPGLAAYPPG